MNGEMSYEDRRLEAWRLVRQAEDLAHKLRVAALSSDSERGQELWECVRRSEDRISRRRYAYACICVGIAPVSAAKVAAWVRDNISRYERFGDVDPAEIAGDACTALGLWDSIGSIPAWVWGLCERVAPRAAEEVIRRRAFYVEKPIRYEADGDCIWA